MEKALSGFVFAAVLCISYAMQKGANEVANAKTNSENSEALKQQAMEVTETNLATAEAFRQQEIDETFRLAAEEALRLAAAAAAEEEEEEINSQDGSFSETAVSVERHHSESVNLSGTNDSPASTSMFSMFSSPAFKGTMYGISGVVVAGGLTNIVLNQVGMEAVKIANMSINLLPMEIAIPVTCAFFIIGLAVSLRPSKKESMAGVKERNLLISNYEVDSRASTI